MPPCIFNVVECNWKLYGRHSSLIYHLYGDSQEYYNCYFLKLDTSLF